MRCFTAVGLVVRFVGFDEETLLPLRVYPAFTASVLHLISPCAKAYFRGDDKALTLYGTQSL